MLTLTIAVCLAADPAVIPVGGKPGPYSFLVATGPQRGQQTCYVCEQDKKPTAIVFTRTLSDSASKLLTKLDAEMAARKESGFKAWMTQLADNADLNALGKWGQGFKSVVVGTFEDADGPPAYQIAKETDVAVVLFVERKVTASFAFKAGELSDQQIEAVMKAVPKLFEKK